MASATEATLNFQKISSDTNLPVEREQLRTCQESWAKRSIKERLQVIRRLRHLIAENDLRLAEAVQKQNHDRRAEVLAAQVLPLAEACRFLERKAGKILAPQRLGSSGRPLWLSGVDTEIRREPLGVVLIIGPANYPLFLPGVQLLQALVAGNVVLVKPGRGGTEVMQLLKNLLVQAGLPEDLIQVLPESPIVVTEAVEAGVDKIVLTGSATTGRSVYRLAAEHLVPIVAELSGCDAMFVLPDADLEHIVKALKFSLRWNGSETCIATRRVYIPRQLANSLEKKLKREIEDLQRSWQPTCPDARVVTLIREALQKGAKPLTASEPDENEGLLPTVLTDVPADAALLQEEIFAPVLSVIPVADWEEALTLSQQCPYALGATIFGSETEARKLAARVQAGVVLINDVIVPTADPRMPFAGRQKSGFGVTRGAEGLLEMTTIKVTSQRKGECRHFVEPQPDDVELFHQFVQASHGSSWWSRTKHWLTLFSLLSKRIFTKSSYGENKE